MRYIAGMVAAAIVVLVGSLFGVDLTVAEAVVATLAVLATVVALTLFD